MIGTICKGSYTVADNEQDRDDPLGDTDIDVFIAVKVG